MGIILDSRLSQALIQPKTTIAVPEVLNEILFSLLLYDKAFIPSEFQNIDNKYLEELIKEDLISIIPKKYFEDEEKRVIKTVSEYQAIDFSGDTLSDYFDGLDMPFFDGYSNELKSRAFSTNDNSRFDDNSEDYSAEYATFLAGNEFSQLQLNKEIIWEYYKHERPKQSINFIPSQLASFGLSQDYAIVEGASIDNQIVLADGSRKWGGKENLEIAIDRYYEDMCYIYSKKDLHRLMAYYNLDIRLSESKEQVAFRLYKFMSSHFSILYDLNYERLHFLKSYTKFKELTQFSYENKLPIKGQIGILSPSKGIKKSCIKNDNAYSVFRILLDEIKFLPRLSSVEDVLRLKEDPCINNFRKTISIWSDAINEGDVRQEIEIRKEMKHANEEFKKLKNYKKIGGWITYISLPFIIVDLLLGVPAGSILTIVGSTVQFKADKLNKKNQWLLFGSRV